MVNVTSLIIGERSVILHHFHRAVSVPCRACFNSHHTNAWCKSAEEYLGELQASRQQKYVSTARALAVPSFYSCTKVADLDQALKALTGEVINHSAGERERVLEPVELPQRPEQSYGTAQGGRGDKHAQQDATGWTVNRRQHRQTSQRQQQLHLAKRRTGNVKLRLQRYLAHVSPS